MSPITASVEHVMIVGAGYVGRSLARACSLAGHRVSVFDQSHRALDLASRLPGVTPVERLEGSDCTPDICILAVNTPVRDHEPNYTPLRNAAAAVAGILRHGTLVINECTVGPGATRRVVAGMIKAHSGLLPAADYQLAYSPERIDPGNHEFTLRTTPKLIAGWDAASSERARSFYAGFVDVVHCFDSIEELEFAKVYENAFRAVAIGLANEAAWAARGLGLDPSSIFAAAATKPFGYTAFSPGVGVGGDCVPTDPWYLIATLREAGEERLSVLESAMLVNEAMPRRTALEVERMLGGGGSPIQGSRVAVLGVGYKPNQANLTNSPGGALATELAKLGADVAILDPLVRMTGCTAIKGAPLMELDDMVAWGPSIGVVGSLHDCLRPILPSLKFPVLDPSAMRPSEAHHA